MNLPKPNLPFEQKDKLYMTSKFKLSLWMRLCILFSSEVLVESEVYTAEEMPSHRAVTGIEAITWWRSLRGWYLHRKSKGLVWIEEPIKP